MDTRRLGREGLEVGAIGLGCMGMSDFYGPRDEREATATIHRALELGVTLLDTADVYGPHTNEELVGRAVHGRPRGSYLVATKFGIVRGSDPQLRGVDGRPEYVRSCCDASLKRLGLETIDLYYQHRVDPKTPIEETVGAMAELVRAGKVRYLGLSEAGPATLRRAPPDVIRHRSSMEPGLSSPAAFRHWRGAAVRPTDADRDGVARARRQGASKVMF